MKRFFINWILILINAYSLWAQVDNKAIVNLPLLRLGKEDVFFVDPEGNKIFPIANGEDNQIKIDQVNQELYHLTITLKPKTVVQLRDLEIAMHFLPDSIGIWNEVKNSFHWMPNMKQYEKRIISQHVFRSPAMILTYKKTALSIIPDLDLLAKYQAAPYYLDIQYTNNGITLKYGMSDYVVKAHQYYEKNNTVFQLPEKLELGMYFICSENSSPLDILKKTNRFLWNGVGKKYQDSILPQVLPYKDYAARGYVMALEKFWVNGAEPNTGGITLSTFLDKQTGLYRGRFYKDDIWFHSWFNNLRTAYGLYYWGREEKNKEWCDKAQSIINLFMTCPQKDGFFPVIWIPEKNSWIGSGEGGGEGLYHMPDQAWTAIWLMRFNDELKIVPGCDSFLTRFADGLLKTQNPNGSFPSRLHISDLSADPILRSSASGAMATWFLEEMIIRNKLASGKKQEVVIAIKRSIEFLEREVLPQQRFEDFEVYFSCSPKPMNYYDSTTCMYPQNTLSIQWCAEAFLKANQLFKDDKYLSEGEYCLNILSLYQQVWNPPYISLYTFGGFGAQNSDAEWSDARQAQFAETYLNYYNQTRNPEYLQRSVYACRASFALMAIPENKKVAPFNFEGQTYNGEYTGAMAENYGHDGINKRSGQSGFHWGTGSALTTAAILKMKLGDIYIDSNSKTAIGVDGIAVQKAEWGDIIRLTTSRLTKSGNIVIHTGKKGKEEHPILLDSKNSNFHF